nr:enoyl-CoA hydratase-related protein [Ruminiclostridium josui]
MGFVAASDIVIADSNAQFSLSELLFGLFPACVLPFLKRKIGLQKAHYMSLMTQPISAQQAYSWGLVDALGDDSELLLRKHFLRLKYISKTAVRKYKKYISMLDNDLVKSKELAVEANRDVFSDPENLNKIFQFIENMK